MSATFLLLNLGEIISLFGSLDIVHAHLGSIGLTMVYSLYIDPVNYFHT